MRGAGFRGGRDERGSHDPPPLTWLEGGGMRGAAMRILLHLREWHLGARLPPPPPHLVSHKAAQHHEQVLAYRHDVGADAHEVDEGIRDSLWGGG